MTINRVQGPAVQGPAVSQKTEFQEACSVAAMGISGFNFLRTLTIAGFVENVIDYTLADVAKKFDGPNEGGIPWGTGALFIVKKVASAAVDPAGFAASHSPVALVASAVVPKVAKQVLAVLPDNDLVRVGANMAIGRVAGAALEKAVPVVAQSYEAVAQEAMAGKSKMPFEVQKAACALTGTVKAAQAVTAKAIEAAKSSGCTRAEAALTSYQKDLQVLTLNGSGLKFSESEAAHITKRVVQTAQNRQSNEMNKNLLGSILNPDNSTKQVGAPAKQPPITVEKVLSANIKQAVPVLVTAKDTVVQAANNPTQALGAAKSSVVSAGQAVKEDISKSVENIKNNKKVMGVGGAIGAAKPFVKGLAEGLAGVPGPGERRLENAGNAEDAEDAEDEEERERMALVITSSFN